MMDREPETRADLSQEELKKYVVYYPLTGIFIRIGTNKYNSCRKNYITGSKTSNSRRKPYKTIMINMVQYKAHRLAWLYMTGNWPDGQIDHINGIHGDNRFCNLRIANHYQNCWNKPLNKNNTSGYTGVGYIKSINKWMASIRFNGEEILIGYFKDKNEAGRARNEYAKNLHGEYYRGQENACNG